MLEDMKRQAQDPSRFMLDVERARGFDPAEEYERSMQEQGMYGDGVVGYAPGGSVGPQEDDFARALRAEGISDSKLAKFLEALYGQESSYGANARPSPSGARGGMQIMPGTFAEVADEDMDINDSLDAMRAGMRYGKRAFSTAGGDPAAARAYYYGGPGGLAAYMAGKDRNTEDPDFPSVREDVERFMSTYYPEPKKESASAPNGLSVQEARDIVAADDVGVLEDLFGVGYKKHRRDAAFAVLKDAGYTRAQIERMRMGGETSADMQAQMTDYSQRAAELEAEIADRERFGGDTSFQRAELADLTRVIDTTRDVASITPAPDRMSDAEIMDMYAQERPQQSRRDADITRQSLQRDYEEGAGNASTVMGQTSVDDILAEMELLAGSKPPTSNETSELTDLLKTRTETILAPGYAESQRSARESAAQTAYAVPEELKQLYRDRQTELESLKRSPEDIRRKELAALLGGIASSPYIARSGTQAYRGMEQVREQARQENIDTAQKNFDISKELVNLDRDASIKAFDAGLTALGEANAAQITAIQTVNNMIQGVQNRELEATLANQSNQLSYLQAQFQNELKKIDVATGIDRDRQATLRTLYTNATDFYDNIVTSKAEQSALLGADAEMMQRINTIYDSLITGAANTIDSISQLLDVGGTIPPITRPATSGTSSAVSAADEFLGIE